jgi:hypothetical protein
VTAAAIRHALYAPGWTRRNRWGLLALPFALAAALVASSDRVQLYFWDEGLHQPQGAAQGAWLAYGAAYHASEGEHPLKVRIRLDSVAPATTGWTSTTPLDLPPGTKAVAVSLSLEADPQLPLSVCRLAVRDTAGNRYDYQTSVGGSQPLSPCVPPDAPGPFAKLGELDKGRDTSGEPVRPRSWTVSPVIMLPAGADVEDVVLWWELPDYASLAVS